MTHNLIQLFSKISEKSIKHCKIFNNFNTKSALPLLRNYSGNDWKDYVKYDNSKYNKIPIYSHPMFDAYLICWLPQQYTLTHNHDTRGCIFKILEGELIENRYFMFTNKSVLKEGFCKGYYDDLYFHDMSNISDKPAVSLHIYGKTNYL